MSPRDAQSSERRLRRKAWGSANSSQRPSNGRVNTGAAYHADVNDAAAEVTHEAPETCGADSGNLPTVAADSPRRSQG
eukprot:9925353-Alexandrium_andersonii.AAC.1